jgi:hypothetical protein
MFWAPSTTQLFKNAYALSGRLTSNDMYCVVQEPGTTNHLGESAGRIRDSMGAATTYEALSPPPQDAICSRPNLPRCSQGSR